MFSHHSTCAEIHLSGRGGDNPAIPPQTWAGFRRRSRTMRLIFVCKVVR